MRGKKEDGGFMAVRMHSTRVPDARADISDVRKETQRLTVHRELLASQVSALLRIVIGGNN